MIIGFGFGPPLVSILMLLITLGLSVGIYWFTSRARRRSDQRRPSRLSSQEQRRRRRMHYYDKRRRARKMSEEFDVSDEEIERRLDQEFGRRQRDEWDETED